MMDSETTLYGVLRDNVIFWSKRKMLTEYFHCANFDYRKPGRFITFNNLDNKSKYVLINIDELDNV
jgi:hypothetical protein